MNIKHFLSDPTEEEKNNVLDEFVKNKVIKKRLKEFMNSRFVVFEKKYYMVKKIIMNLEEYNILLKYGLIDKTFNPKIDFIRNGTCPIANLWGADIYLDCRVVNMKFIAKKYKKTT